MARGPVVDPVTGDRPGLQSPHATPASPPNGDGAARPGAVVGSKPLTRCLRQYLWQKSGYAVLSLDGQPRLLIDFAHDHAVVLSGALTPATQSLAQALGEGFDRMVLQDVSPSRFSALAKDQAHQPLRPILWQVAQHGVDWGDLGKRLLRHARIRLLRWPDFRLLAHQHDGFRLCSLLLKRPCTLEECRQLLGLDAQTVEGFVRSAYLCGYAMVETPAGASDPAPPVVAPPTGSLLARMWRSLRGPSA